MSEESFNTANDFYPLKKDKIRSRIETVLRNKNDVFSNTYAKSLEELVEELKVYQYELEFQNDELQRIQLDLENSRDSYRKLFHQAPMGYVVLSEDLRLIEFNDAFNSIFNFAGPIKTNADFRRLISQESQNDFHFFWRELLQNNNQSSVEIRVVHETGQLKHVKVNGIFLPAMEERHILLALVDITNRKRVEAELNKRNRMFNLALDASSTALWELNLQTLELSVEGDDAVRQLIGTNPAEMKKLTSDIWLQWILEEDQESIRDAIKNVTEQGDSLHVLRCRMNSPSGHATWVELKGRLTQLDELGNPLILSGIINDINKHVEYEDLLAKQNQELISLNNQKDRFYSIIAHDLRSPFNGFLGFTRILSEELNSMSMTEIQRIADLLRNSSVNMFRLIENLLQWSRIQQGSLPFDPLELDLPPLVMESIDLIVEAAGKKEITIITELPAKLMVIADENFVKTIFRNLLFNAVKFTSRGGKLSICLKKEGEDTALFSIHDSGIGMSADLVENLFINNVSTNRKGTDGEPTTGLGLILCKELVEKMNGRIWAESAENHGSTFYITIPLSSQNTADGFK